MRPIINLRECIIQNQIDQVTTSDQDTDWDQVKAKTLAVQDQEKTRTRTIQIPQNDKLEY